jgi:hypothetical protein
MATKAELEKKVKVLELALEESNKVFVNFKDKVDEGLKQVLTDNCREAFEPVEEFCRIVDIEMPTRVLKLEITLPYGEEFESIETDEATYNEGDCIKFEYHG